jgi:O-antigen/teichoic acid export membrane protein
VKVELVKSSISGVVQFIVSTLLVFITIPIFIKVLGVESYGVYSLVALVGSVNTFANLGLSVSLVRFLSEQGKTRESDHDIVMTLIILAIIITPLVVCGVYFRKFILLQVLNVPWRLLNDAVWLFFAMLASNVLILFGQVFSAILDSQQKIYLTNLYQILYNMINSGLLLIVLLLGRELKYVALPILMSTLVWFCTLVISSIQMWGRLSLRGLKTNWWRITKKQLSYGTQIYLSGLVLLLYEPFTKILVSHFIGIAEVGIFDIGLKVKNQVYGFMAKLLYPLFPFLSKLTDPQKTRDIVHDTEQKLFFIVMPLIGIILVVSKPLMALFFHSNVDVLAITVACIVSGYLIGSITVTPMFQYLTVKGHVTLTIFIQLINVVVNVLAFLAMYQWLGYYAVVAANVIAILSSFFFLLYSQKKYLNSLIFDSFWQVIVVVMSFIMAIILGFSFILLFGGHPFDIIVCPIVILGVTLFLYRVFALFTHADISRYFGEENIFAKTAVRVLCKP